jgi:PPIC-type PPIASE domain
MSSPTILLVNEQPISLEQAIEYLQTSGRLQEFLLDILSQHILTQEVQSKVQLDLSSATIEQFLIDFRTENELIDPNVFQAWLASYGWNYETFRQQLIWNLSLSHLQDQISQPQLHDYFQERKPLLDRVVLSWIGVDTEEQAKTLREELDWGADFAQLVEAHFHPNDPDSSALEVSLTWEEIPEVLIDLVDAAEAGDLLEPIAIEDQWYVFRVEAFQPAELDEGLAAELRDELFEQWLAEQVQQTTVTLQLN